MLMYCIAGSALTGDNRSTAFCRDGRMVRYEGRVLSLASRFRQLNGRYDEARARFEAYSLSETIAHLKAKDAEEYAEWARSNIDGVVDAKVTADGVVVDVA